MSVDHVVLASSVATVVVAAAKVRMYRIYVDAVRATDTEGHEPRHTEDVADLIRPARAFGRGNRPRARRR